MLPSYLKGQVLKVTVGDLQTYVIVVTHIFKHKLGFKSLLAQDSPFSISVDELQHYRVIIVGSENGENYGDLLKEMKSDSARHLRIWELFHPEGHYNSDSALAALHSDGVLTSKSPAIIANGSRN
jgi:hypothetical protein